MKLIKSHNDFLIDKLFEILVDNTGELQFILSDKLDNLIKNINHPIAKRMLLKKFSINSITLIDATDKNDTISFANSPKLISFLNDYNNNKDKTKRGNKDLFTILNFSPEIIWKKYRSEMKVGRFVKKLFGERFPPSRGENSIENFVNSYKSTYNMMFDDINKLFDIVSGQDIIKWYDQDSYAPNGSGSVLNNSCMAYNCEEMLQFYAINSPKVRMIVLFLNEDKKSIIGRALLWKLGGSYEGKFLLDRIYTQQEYQVDFFIEYAKQNGWFWKTFQGTGDDKISGEGLANEYPFLEVEDIKPTRYFPYLDTLDYYSYSYQSLYNEPHSGGEELHLDVPGGAPSNAYWSSYYDIWISIDDENYNYCELGTQGWDEGDKYRENYDSTYIEIDDSEGGWIPNTEVKEKTEVIDGEVRLKLKYK